MDMTLKRIKAGLGLPPLEEKPVRVYKLNDGDIFTIDIFTFLKEKLYESSSFHVMTREEIKKANFTTPIGYGLIMVRFEK